jgi:glycine/D-amino acid oxidase-like deaminating enzyme
VEIFQESDTALMEKVRAYWSELSSTCHDYLGQMPFQWSDQDWGLKGIVGSIAIEGEGMLHPVMMLNQWERLCRDCGVRFLHGLNIESVDQVSGKVIIRGKEIFPERLIVCTNGLTPRLLEGLDVFPARNQVLVTNEILDFPWDRSFHQREGYIYFRNIGRRVLIGGARDCFRDHEWTDSMEVNPNVIHYLKEHLANLLGHQRFEIESQWSGVMGLGNGKGPIIEKISNHVYVAVRMGGIGVAIGTAVGKRLSELID